MGLKK